MIVPLPTPVTKRSRALGNNRAANPAIPRYILPVGLSISKKNLPNFNTGSNAFAI